MEPVTLSIILSCVATIIAAATAGHRLITSDCFGIKIRYESDRKEQN